jgi:hypothetical protein
MVDVTYLLVIGDTKQGSLHYTNIKVYFTDDFIANRKKSFSDRHT